MPKTKQETSSQEKSAERWFGIRLTPAQKAQIERLAKRKDSTQKDAVLEAVEHALRKEEAPIEPRPGSFLEAAQDLAGSVEGPRDLSTNPKYMEDYGKD